MQVYREVTPTRGVRSSDAAMSSRV
jgi:hypothetical protein